MPLFPWLRSIGLAVENQVSHIAYDVIVILIHQASSRCHKSLSLDLLVMLHHGLADSLNLSLVLLALFDYVGASGLISCIIPEESLISSVTKEIHLGHFEGKRLLYLIHHCFKASLNRVVLHHAMLIYKLLELQREIQIVLVVVDRLTSLFLKARRLNW